jgi:hypothetical protein
MNEYWKDPWLDDEGTYDYLAEELPSDTSKWQWWYEKCDSCGKHHRRNFVSTHYFYCWDGWDSMSYTECWKCRLRDKVHAIKAKIKRKIKARKEYRDWIRRFKEKGVEITEELKKTIHSIVNKEVMR